MDLNFSILSTWEKHFIHIYGCSAVANVPGSAGRNPLPYPERLTSTLSSFSASLDDGLYSRLRLVDGAPVRHKTQTAIAPLQAVALTRYTRAYVRRMRAHARQFNFIIEFHTRDM